MSPTYLTEGTLGDSYLNYVEPALSEKGPSELVVLQKNRDFQIKKIERLARIERSFSRGGKERHSEIA